MDFVAVVDQAITLLVWGRRAPTGEPHQGLIGPDDRLRCMWPHHALRRPPIAWHARDMTGPLGMTVPQHHEASHAAYPPNARAYRGAPRVSRTAKMRDTSLGTPTSRAIASRVSFRNRGVLFLGTCRT